MYLHLQISPFTNTTFYKYHLLLANGFITFTDWYQFIFHWWWFWWSWSCTWTTWTCCTM